MTWCGLGVVTAYLMWANRILEIRSRFLFDRIDRMFSIGLFMEMSIVSLEHTRAHTKHTPSMIMSNFSAKCQRNDVVNYALDWSRESTVCTFRMLSTGVFFLMFFISSPGSLQNYVYLLRHLRSFVHSYFLTHFVVYIFFSFVRKINSLSNEIIPNTPLRSSAHCAFLKIDRNRNCVSQMVIARAWHSVAFVCIEPTLRRLPRPNLG